MVQTFFKLLKSKLHNTETPSPAEVSAALQQLKDVHKLAAVITIFAFPGGTTTLLTLNALASKYGMTIFPSAFDLIEAEIRTDEKYYEYVLEELVLTSSC